MAKPKGLLEEMKAELIGGLRSQYFNIATNVFKWKNMPDEIPIRYPEKWLYENGTCVFLEVPSAGYACLPVMVGSIENNMYGEPAKWKAVAVGKMAGVVSKLELNSKNSVLIRNDFQYRATKPYVETLIKQLVNVELTMRLNINAQKNPVWVKTSSGTSLRDKNAYMEFYECEPVQFHESMSKDAFEFVNADIKYIGNELADTYNIYDYRIMTYLGIDNAGVDKKERMLVSESESMSDKIMMIRNSRLEQRKIACDQITDVFGLDISVECNQDLNSEKGYGQMQGTPNPLMESGGFGKKD